MRLPVSFQAFRQHVPEIQCISNCNGIFVRDFNKNLKNNRFFYFTLSGGPVLLPETVL